MIRRNLISEQDKLQEETKLMEEINKKDIENETQQKEKKKRKRLMAKVKMKAKVKAKAKAKECIYEFYRLIHTSSLIIIN